jgi:hypothetical protein
MSCYNWEEGAIVIPAKQWAAFRSAIIEKVNEEREKLYLHAKVAFNAAKIGSMGKRGFDQNRFLHNDHRFWDVARFITRPHCTKAFTPKKKDFPKLPKTKSAVLHLEEVTITLDNTKHAVTYSVCENNRAVERARENPVVELMFSLLRAINWTRGSGGEIVGNDEYNRDARDSGGGGNYVTANFNCKGRSHVVRY